MNCQYLKIRGFQTLKIQISSVCGSIRCWEGLGAGGEGDDRGWDGWMASPTWWTWVWVNSGSWWWTGKPGVLQFIGSQRVRYDWATELNWTEDLAILVLPWGMAARLQSATVPLGSASMLDSCSVATSWVLKSPDQVISKGPGSSIVTANLVNTRVLDLRLGAHSSRSRGRNNEVTSCARLLQSCPWSREAKSLSTTCLATSALESWMKVHGSGQASLQKELTQTDSGSWLLRGVLSAVFFRLWHRGFSGNGKGFYLGADGLASPGSGWWLSRVCCRTVRLWQDPGAKGP